jgi:hypothetical protein
MSKINKEWHEINKMPQNASDEQRIAWHLEHSRNCSCRSIPSGVIKLMKKNGIEIPKDQRNI